MHITKRTIIPKTYYYTAFVFIICLFLNGCSNNIETFITENQTFSNGAIPMQNTDNILQNIGQNPQENIPEKQDTIISLNENILLLENGFSAVQYKGDYGFNDFLLEGGASTDADVVKFLSSYLFSGINLAFTEPTFGCNTIAIEDANNEFLFGRNFDWQACEAMVVLTQPENGYASLSTVNLDFINVKGSKLLEIDQARILAAIYAPLDGMNEMGLAVSVNMIQDSATISQNTERPDITTTTAIRLLLDKAANVDEALLLLQQYDLHASMGMMVHFALADKQGRSVAVEYIDNSMVVIETPILTNFYLAEGEKQGIGTAQSHERYQILTHALGQKEPITMETIRDILDSVSKDNFNEFESTEWSIVFNLNSRIAHYYHQEDYSKAYTFSLSLP